MISAPLHPQEKNRLTSLRALQILDTLPESEYDQITFLASQICNTPIALISLIDENRQWFKSKVGLAASETHRDFAYCAHAILQKDVFIVKDASQDKRFFDNPLAVDAPHVQFYAGAPLYAPDGMPIGTVCVIDNSARDIAGNQIEALQALSQQVTRLLTLKLQVQALEESERNLKQNEEIRQSLQAQLLESARLSALGEMAGGVAHEINNPLAIIRGRLAILKKKYKHLGAADQQMLNEEVSIVEKTVDRITKIVKGLRTYSRNSEGDPAEKVLVTSVIEDAVSMCEERFKLADVEVQTHFMATAFVLGHSSQLVQILMNLLINSYDAISLLEKKWIRITTSKSGNEIQLAVEDSGAGISEEIAKKMMEPFFTTKEVGKGTGLGLSISMAIAEAHGGKLVYDSTSTNTRFVLTLPIDKLS